MATATLNPSAQVPPSSSPFNPRQQKRHIPSKSSPLACPVSLAPAASDVSSSNTPAGIPNIAARRAAYFPTSRPLRPFASITPKASSKPVKTFEIPEAFKSGCFMLNLTQAEFSRQE